MTEKPQFGRVGCSVCHNFITCQLSNDSAFSVEVRPTHTYYTTQLWKFVLKISAD